MSPRLQAEAELGDVQQQLAEVSNNYNSVSTIRRKLEEEVTSLHVDLDEMLNEARTSEEKAKKAMIDAARLAWEEGMGLVIGEDRKRQGRKGWNG